MGKIIDETNNIYGKLTVLYKDGIDKHGKYKWMCVCECENFTSVIAGDLRRGKTKSCGCGAIKHGLRSNIFYTVWNNMINRCYDITNKQYKDYGGRGITVCEDWHNLDIFIEWCESNYYKEGLQIDRINNNEGYSPNNCQFISSLENNAVGKRKKIDNTSGYIGVSFSNSKNKWISYISIDNKRKWLGHFNNIEDALKARTNAEIQFLGEQKTNLADKLKESVN